MIETLRIEYGTAEAREILNEFTAEEQQALDKLATIFLHELDDEEAA